MQEYKLRIRITEEDYKLWQRLPRRFHGQYPDFDGQVFHEGLHSKNVQDAKKEYEIAQLKWQLDEKAKWHAIGQRMHAKEKRELQQRVQQLEAELQAKQAPAPPAPEQPKPVQVGQQSGRVH